MNSRALDYTALTLVIIGAVNWALIGILKFDLVAFLYDCGYLRIVSDQCIWQSYRRKKYLNLNPLKSISVLSRGFFLDFISIIRQ